MQGPIDKVAQYYVSILIRPEGRMQLRVSASITLEKSSFQSSSGQKAGCNRAAPTGSTLLWPCFNPHPARRPDATRPIDTGFGSLFYVSILIRPEGRMQRGGASSRWTARQTRFQSSSGQKAGCNTVLTQHRVWYKPFQSSSGQKAGCNSRDH